MGSGLLIVLLAMFYARQFEYRDGRHADMDAFPGEIFPALQGIRTTPERFAQLKELSYFIKKYGGNYAVLPAFT